MNIKQENYQALLKYTNLLPEGANKSIRHEFREYANLLPFPTREPERATFANGIEPILGEFVRRVSEVDVISLSSGQEEIIERLLNTVEIDEKDIPNFKELFRNYLENENDQMKIFHPYVYHFLSFSEGQTAKGEKNIGGFIYDVLGNGDNIKEYFSNDDVEDILSKLLLDNLGELKVSSEKVNFSTKLPHITKMFNEDFNFLAQKKESFMKEFPMLLAYYYFFYITQMTLKLNQGFKADYEENTPLYWFLDFETSSKSRKGYKEGYSVINQEKASLLPHMNTLAHLNVLVGSHKSLTYTEIETYIEESGQEDLLNEMLVTWIGRYRRETSQVGIEEYPEDYLSLVKLLRDSIRTGLTQATIARYPKSIENIGKKFFLKRRSSLGYALNATQEFILLMTSFAIKEDRMPLNEVFEFLESRGLYFDRYSKEEIVILLDKLNLMDKKSDSGDAQYVKSIL